MGELQIADVRAQVALSLLTDFENFTIFKPDPRQEASVNGVGEPPNRFVFGRLTDPREAHYLPHSEAAADD
jgi:hypothetical protein